MKCFAMIACLVCSLVSAPVYSKEVEAQKLEAATSLTLDVLYEPVYEDLSDQERQVEVRDALEKEYDLNLMIRRAIGRNWKQLDAAQQAQVSALIKELIVRAYVEGMKGFDRPVITYGKTIHISGKRLEVPMRISFSDGDVFNVVYRMGRMKSGWQIYDIVAEDISMIANYRQQFDDHFRKGDGAGLIEKLEALLMEDELDENTTL